MLNSVLNNALAPSASWKTAYPLVEEEAKRVLNATARDTRLTTTQFADMIYSKDGEDFDPFIRRRLFKALAALSEHGMVHYVSLGPVEQIGPKKINGRRKLWGYPSQELIPPNHPECPTCHRPL